jgi:peptidoglycan/xylan/chitin deacetylase (PgdA/CDA1 family)
MNNSNGILIISLDFELYWGLLGIIPLEKYEHNILGGRSIIPRLLNLFKKYQIHPTWAIIGFLFFDSRQELLEALPGKRPDYFNRRLCPYNHIAEIGENEQKDPIHYAPSLINMIIHKNNMEIASHTFSHYYPLESGQNIDSFKKDLEAALKVASNYGLTLQSLVFPGNQINKDYLTILKELGIKAYRGNESSWFYQMRCNKDETMLRRGLRLLDAYVNISGHNAYDQNIIRQQFPFNLASSRFLRPYSKKLARFEPLRLARILADLTYAAQNGLVYHLWWHPHNFGINQEENLKFLESILEHFIKMKNFYGMQSLTMNELSSILLYESA